MISANINDRGEFSKRREALLANDYGFDIRT